MAIYNLEIFNQSETGSALARRFGAPTNLDVQETLDIAAFLRVINARDNILEAQKLLSGASDLGFWNRNRADEAILQAWHETEDAILVLQGANLHPWALARLQPALVDIRAARDGWIRRQAPIERATHLLQLALLELVDEAELDATVASR